MFKILLASIFSFSSLCLAQEKTSAVLYDLKSKQTKKLYTLNIETTVSEMGTRSQTTYKDLEGKVLVSEVGLAAGDDLKEYTIERPQTNEKGRITIHDGKVFFEYEGADGKKKTDDERIKGKILCAANFTAFVKNNWSELSGGKAIPVRYAVWDRRETVGFTLEKVGDPEVNGKKTMEVRMKPTSFVIAAIVDPVHLFYSAETKSLVLMKGRVPPKIQVDGKWKDLDAETVYTKD